MAAGVFLNPACASSTSLSSTEFVDHYVILSLDHWATSEEIKTQHRKLRGEIFRTDPEKYRALQSAYAVLVDREARLQYDTIYRQRLGLPAPPPLPTTIAPQASPHDQFRQSVALSKVMDMVQKLEKPVETASARARTDDPNWALKHPNPTHKPLAGTQSYQSSIPLSIGWRGAGPMDYRGSKYVGGNAVKARPV